MLRYPTTCYNEACTNNWNAWTNACLSQENLKDRNSWKKINVAQICEQCSFELQHLVPSKHWLRARVFLGHVPSSVIDLKLGIRRQKILTSNSQIAEYVLEQAEMIFQTVRKNTMQAYIKYEAYCDKANNASKLKKQQYVYVLQTKADHQGSKIPFTDFRWKGPFIVENVFSIKNYSVRKLGKKQNPSPSSHKTTTIHA